MAVRTPSERPVRPYRYSRSGYSNLLTTFRGGDAIIGLHVTNRTDLLGHDVSSGGMSNDAVAKLAHLSRSATPSPSRRHARLRALALLAHPRSGDHNAASHGSTVVPNRADIAIHRDAVRS